MMFSALMSLKYTAVDKINYNSDVLKYPSFIIADNVMLDLWLCGNNTLISVELSRTES